MAPNNGWKKPTPVRSWRQFFEVSPSGAILAAAACEPGCGVHAYDLATMECCASLLDCDSEVFGLAFADAHTVYAAFGDSKARKPAALCAPRLLRFLRRLRQHRPCMHLHRCHGRVSA